MKTKFLCFTVLVLLTLSCNKEKLIDKGDGQKYAVNFKLSTFSQEIVNLKSTQALADNVSYLYYLVYNSGGILVNSKTQTSIDSTFGSISDKLLIGSYTIIFVATKKIVNFYSQDRLDAVGYYFPYPNDGFDSFTKVLNITVSTSNISQSVILERNVGSIEVNITDTMPNNAKIISINMSNYGSSIYLSGNYTGGGSHTVEKPVSTSDIGKPNFKIGTLMFPPSDTLSVDLRCYDSSHNLLADKMIYSVSCLKNKRTILKGRLFGGVAGGNSSFTVNVNPSFDNDSIKITF